MGTNQVSSDKQGVPERVICSRQVSPTPRLTCVEQARPLTARGNVHTSTSVSTCDNTTSCFSNQPSLIDRMPGKSTILTSSTSSRRYVPKKSQQRSQDASEDLLHTLDSSDRYGHSRYIKYINSQDNDLNNILGNNKKYLTDQSCTDKSASSQCNSINSHTVFGVAGRTIKQATRHIDAQGKKIAFGSQSMINLATVNADTSRKLSIVSNDLNENIPTDTSNVSSSTTYARSSSFVDSPCADENNDSTVNNLYSCMVMNRSPSATGIRSIIESQLAQEKEAITTTVRNQETRGKRNKKRSSHKNKCIESVDVKDTLTSPFTRNQQRPVSQFSCLPSRNVYSSEGDTNQSTNVTSDHVTDSTSSAATTSSTTNINNTPVHVIPGNSKFHDCSPERIAFYKTTVQLLRKGKRGSAASWSTVGSSRSNLYSNGIIELVFKQELRDLIWLEIKGWMGNRSMIDEDKYLCAERKKIPQTFEKILKFRFNSQSKSNKQQVNQSRVDENKFNVIQHDENTASDTDHVIDCTTKCNNSGHSICVCTSSTCSNNVNNTTVTSTTVSSNTTCTTTTTTTTTTSDLRAIISADVLAASVAMKLSITANDSSECDKSTQVNTENGVDDDKQVTKSSLGTKSDACVYTSSRSTSNGSSESIAIDNGTCKDDIDTSPFITNYTDDSPSIEEENCFCSETLSRLCQSCVDKETEALEQANQLINQLEWCESLYPCTKTLSYDHPHYSSEPVNSRIKSLYLFVNITRDMRQKIYLLSKLFQINDLTAAGWPNFSSNSTTNSTAHSSILTGEESHDVTPEIRVASFTGYSHKLSADSSLWSRNGNNSAAKHVHFQMRNVNTGESNTDVTASTPESPCVPGNSKESPHINTVNDKNDNLFFRPKPSIYRRYVDKSLKHKGLRYIYHQLSHILRPLLYKVHAALKKPVNYTYPDALASNNSGEWSSPHVTGNGKKLWPISREYCNELSNHGVWSLAYQQMALPTFHRPFLFLLRVTVDVVHECLRLRLEQQPENASAVSVSQLIRECREVIRAGVQIRQRYINLARTVLGEGGTDAIEAQLDTFDDDLKSMLILYLRYLDQYMFFMRQLSSQTSSTLKQKGYLEDEWQFVRNFCVHIPDGESLAANKFCRMASDLLLSIGEYLQTGLEESFNTFNESISSQNSSSIRQGVLRSCRSFKSILQEASSRAVHATAFAKSLRKDLEFAAQFKCNVELDTFLTQLQTTGHIRVVSPSCLNYLMFVPASMQGNESCIWQLVDLTCGGRRIDSEVQTNGYLLLVSHIDKQVTWNGATILLEPSVDSSISFSHVQLNGILLVTDQPCNIEMQCRNFQVIMTGTVKMYQQHTSCNQSIVQSLTNLKEKALNIQDCISESLAEITRKIDVSSINELTYERNSLQQRCLDLCHLAFRFAFEYERALTRLITGDLKSKLSKNLMKTAVQWIDFIQVKCDDSKALRARWTNQGIQFLLVALEPQFIKHLTVDEYNLLKNKVSIITQLIRDQQSSQCIGKCIPSSVYSSNLALTVTDMSRPLACSLNFQRSQSVTSVKGVFGQDTPSLTNAIRSSPSSSSTSSSTHNHTIIDNNAQVNKSSTRLEEWALHSNTNHLKNSPGFSHSSHQHDTNECKMNRLAIAVNLLDEKRRKYLQMQRVIGDVSTVVIQRAPLQLAARKVNFPWQRGFKIGEGRFGKVYTAVNSSTGELIAMKEIHLQSNDQRALKETIDELRTLEGIKHPNLVRYFGVEVHRDDLYIFMEYCNEGTLESAVELNLPEQLVRKYTRQLLEAVNILHENSIVHRDIKSANILLTSDGTLKLGDFGCCMKLKNQTTMAGELSAFVGTPAYMAPEIFTRNIVDGHGRAADIWSIGCVVLEMMTGRRPWHDLDNSYQIMFKVGMGETPEVPPDLSEEAADFIHHCLIHDPRLRSSTCQLLSHPFTKADVEQEEER